MTKKGFVTIKNVLESPAGRLRDFAQGAERILKYDALVRQCLSDPLAKHARVANVEDARLVIHADSPTWCARLRYQIPQLSAHLAPHGIRTIRIVTRPRVAVAK